jgi:hypothetical protein
METEYTLDRAGNGTGMPTPWGKAQSTTIYEPGLMKVDTASHGGFLLTRQFAHDNLSEAGRKRGESFGQFLAYEEDSDALIVIFELGARLGDPLAPEVVRAALEGYLPEYLSEREAAEVKLG